MNRYNIEAKQSFTIGSERNKPTFMRICAENVSKYYGLPTARVSALEAVSFDLPSGQSLAICGVSGAGKSTLLNLLGGLDCPSEGKIQIGDSVLSEMSESEESKFRNSKLGYVFQFHHLLNDFTLLENVMMPLLIQSVSRANAKKRATEMLARVDLTGKESRFPQELSGGEQQRGAIARALVHDPKLILADEPTGNLDDRNGSHVFDLLCHLNHDLGATLVVVTHHTDFADKLQHRLVLEQGRVKSFQ